jgi:glycosyltransferase involved in cell wall biosynthesis
VKITVVVPVWNPGTYLDRCIDSFLGQSLPADEFEVVFVDDGSTDDTPRRLDDLAAAHPAFRVIHIPNSGWPGRPRNLGIEAAHGEYVQFVDQDDHLAPEALERLYAMGVRNDADIVIGKVTSDFRGVPSTLFRRDRQTCTIADAPLIDSLTPHKMFRRAFLQEHAIAFPEGRRRLEDQLFVIRAYFRARVVSVLSSYPCYFYMRRDDAGNAGSTRIDPPGYYGNLREVLDTVVLETTPGPFRDRLLRRFYRGEMLGRLSDEWYLSQEPAYQDLLFRTIRELAIECMDENVEAGLPLLPRLRARLLRGDDPAAMQGLARRTSQAGASAQIRAVDWAAGRLRLSFEAEGTVDSGGDPVTLVRRGSRLLLDPAWTEGLGVDPMDATDDVADCRATVSVRHRLSAVKWDLPTQSTVRLEPLGGEPDDGAPIQCVVAAVGSIGAVAMAGGPPLDLGTWDVNVHLSVFGLARRAGLAVDDPAQLRATLKPALLGDPVRLIVPRLEDDGLVLDVGGIDGMHAALIGQPVAVRPSGGFTLTVALPVAADGRTGHIPASLTLESTRGTQRRPAALVGQDGVLTLTARLGIVRERLAAGTYQVSMELSGDPTPLPLGTLRAMRDGRAFLDGGRRTGLVASGVGQIRTAVRATARRLPAPVKSRLRRLVRAASPKTAGRR